MSHSPQRPGVEMRHLRLVALIAEHGSLTSVARVLRISQPALSHQLRELETRLRAPLFERTARRMVLTPAGEQLNHIAQGVLAQIDAFERQVADGDFSIVRGTIRVATECYTAYHWLPGLLREFQKRWPNVELRVSPEHTASPVAALLDGALDLALVYRRTPDKRIRLEPVFEDELVVVTAPDHRFAQAEYVPVRALADEHLFIYSSLATNRSVLRDILDSANVQPRKTTSVQLTEAILELVAAGFGIAVLAKWAVLRAVSDGVVRTTRLEAEGCVRTWYSAVRSSDVTPAYQFDLIELLRRQLTVGLTTAVAPQLRLS